MKFTSIKQIPKEAIEMIDDVQWWLVSDSGIIWELAEQLNSIEILDICSYINSEGAVIFPNKALMCYIEPRELEDKTYGINLYKKIHGEGR